MVEELLKRGAGNLSQSGAGIKRWDNFIKKWRGGG